VAETETLEADGIYLIEYEDHCEIVKGSEFAPLLGVDHSVRKANARGGFGYKAGEEPKDQAIDNTDACDCKIEKVVRNGQVIIIRDGREFNGLGAEL
jgi:hypothetical protein